ncbi:hook-length control protein FliK [Butyrivibrio sp. ob235]|uniref:flagellar hook-length control protein FliK n=1 Tax=Butyrivibrio sp. ob235 TaxID=1761780 RepID=UPI0008C0AF93|nr:flagellar hook-length control protein FliK [Butyrivibrio sp. ob235]SEK44907.1 hook-length control protein FliK [Butyrivibrio sp. ob235]
MISNAIPGIGTLNTYTNTQTAKGIAATKEQTTDFQKALLNANSQKQTASITTDVARTLTQTGAATNNVSATYEKSQAAQQASTQNSEQTAVKETTTTDETTAAKTDTQKENVTAEEAVETSNVTEQTEENAQVVAVTEENAGEDTAAIAAADEAETALEQAMLESSRLLMEQLADELGVDIEDIENAMATLGLTNVAILDPTNLTQIVGQLTGANDVMAIVTNADLYLNVQNMQDAVDTTRQNLMEEFGLNEEGFNSALEDFNEALSEQQPRQEIGEIVADTNNPAITQTFENAVSSEAVRLDLTGDGIVKEVSQQVAEATKTEETTTTTEAAGIAENEEATPNFQLTVETQEHHEEHHSDNKKQENTEGSVYNQVMNQISASLTEVVETESYGQMARANTQEIMDQITEYIKMNVRSDTTTMELQLHPASLGNVNVIIEAAKDGNVIAKFLTQNEDVRAAIESQIQQLQDKLNEQGVKVTAVEVTVNAGAFDQALNDSQSQREDDADAQSSVRKPMRRIRLGDLSLEEVGEIAEEDQLTAEMMAINGNSVDFSA